MKLNRLNARTVATITKPGRHADGGNLYLVVSPTGSKSWSLFFRWKADPSAPGAGKMRELGLGPLGTVSLALARQLAAEAREKAAMGIDPIAERRKAAATRNAITFGQVAEEHIRAMEPGWRNSKHAAQWRYTLSLERDEDGSFKAGGYCSAIRDKAVDQVSTEDVLAILTPIWAGKNETASRVRGRIEAVLDAAKAKGLRTGENPARWKGHLALTLPKRQKLQRGNHAALPYSDLPAFVRRLRLVRGMSSFALEFAILTAARSGEVRGARWSEIDLDARLWTIPAERMKAGRIHRVPLTNRAVEILQTVGQLGNDPERFVFPGMRKGSQLSDVALIALLRRLEVDATAHGFRSTFRDWAGDTTAFPREVAEAALAHAVGDATELAYRRGDALEKRRELMDAWDAFVCSSPANPSAAR
ncbi:integrase arm-type DNA-binding domain-containing protein [Aquabacter sp. L1I39]|uniref:tyrosine-type recombinase/integrase n=1 Tax=Aquabacter sp. L1I39 TaxID=2820278 RepID=UPI001AD98AC8|nr:site-specific integrase [Aquabacter sp. L1I39]QTL04040.1 integrase arm-type DNA-binding domain-containing protein [Aquabacter sp. L1I39]